MGYVTWTSYGAVGQGWGRGWGARGSHLGFELLNFIKLNQMYHLGALGHGAGVLWVRFRKSGKPVPRERRMVPIRITSRDKNGQESAIFNAGQRSRNALRLPWMETNWNGKVRFKCLLCQLVCY